VDIWSGDKFRPHFLQKEWGLLFLGEGSSLEKTIFENKADSYEAEDYSPLCRAIKIYREGGEDG
jgi:hypothetical protein